MNPSLRKLAVTAHIISSVGWLGAVGVFLALAVAGFTSHAADRVQASAFAMELTTWWVIVPSAGAALLSGVLVSIGGPWGLFGQRWVVAKLVITVLATALLLVHTRPIGALAMAARIGADSEVARLQAQLIADAGGALLVLGINVLLSVFKPWGATRFGQRPKQGAKAASAPLSSRAIPVPQNASRCEHAPRWLYIVGLHALGLAVLLVVGHLTGHVPLPH